MPGQFVKVRFVGSVRTGVVLVPQRAVQVGPGGATVYVVADGDKVELRNVQATGWEGNQWLIEEGLRAGERVVVNGLQKIMPGEQVKTVPYVAADNAGQPEVTNAGDVKSGGAK